MRLYYYTSQQYGIQSLNDRRLKIARFTELNDPFDWIGIATNTAQHRRELRKLKQKFDLTNGLLCMSTSWDVPLLWSHYADKHRGICLGFEVDEDDWEQVDYVDERPTLQTYNRPSVTSLRLSDIHHLMKTKGGDWKYEAEYRKFIRLGAPDLRTGLYFQPFSTGMKLISIHVGERSSVPRSWIKGLVEHNGGTIEMQKVRTAYRSYKVVLDSPQNWK
jgi:hypothetical protein